MRSVRVMSIVLKLLRLAGIMDCNQIWYPILAYSAYIPVLIGQLYALYQYWGDMDAIVENLIMMLCYIICHVQAAYCFFHRQDIQRIIEYIEEKPIKMHGEEVQEIFKKTKIRSDKMSWLLIIISTVIVTSWTITPFIMYYTQTSEMKQQSDPNKPFPYLCVLMSFPFDVTYSPVYELVFLLQATIQTTATIYILSVTAFIVCVIMHTASHFTALAALLRKLGSHDDLILENADDAGDVSNKYGRHLTTKKSNNVITEPDFYLDQCIQQHQDILNFAEKLREFLSPLLVIFFRIMEILMCVTVFQLVLTLGNDDGSVYKYVVAFSGTLALPYFMCLYGEHFKQQSILVEEEVCSCLWYTQSMHFKKNLLTMIMRSQRPLELKVGIFYPLTLETFGKMLNTAYTYFTLLKQLKDG